MTRKKIDLAYIASDPKRKATYKKRKNGIIKKMDEISTLCGIEACAIIYGRNEPQPEVWPSDMGVERVLSKLRKMPEMDQSKKMLTQETFLSQSIMKVKEHWKKLKNENRKIEMELLMHQCLSTGVVVDNVNNSNLNDLSCMIDQTLKGIEKQIIMVKSKEETPTIPMEQEP